MFIEIAKYSGVILISAVIIWYACGHLELAAHRLSKSYGLPEIIKGSMIMAIGSSFPEFATVVLAGMVHGDYELGFATIVGSAIFNILVIPAASVFFRAGAFGTDRDIIFRETQFYLISVLLMMVVLALAVIFFPVGSTGLKGELSLPLVMVPLGLYMLYVFIQFHEVLDHEMSAENQSLPVMHEWFRLLVSMAAITIGVELLVRTAIGLSNVLDTPSFFWGVTVIAVVTSVPDLFLSVKAARRKTGVASLSNALGSNIFDLLVIAPVGVLVAGAVIVDFSHIFPMMSYLALSSAVVLVLMRRNFALINREALLLLLLYIGFVLWMGLKVFGGAEISS